MPIRVRSIRCPAAQGVHFVSAGKGPFDVYGFLMNGTSRFIAAELKESRDQATSMAIVAPDRDGTGLQFHQLAALSDVASAGGVAKLIWDNGGAYRVLHEQQIIVAYSTYVRAIQSRNPARGAKSIPANVFDTLDFATVGGYPVLDWLG